MKKKKVNDIGLEAKAPAGVCDGEKCPWHGRLKIRGRVFEGKIVSSKPSNTAIISWNYYKYIPKYERYERRKTKIESHNPKCIDAKAGDMVRIGECRPLSKSKRFVVFEKVLEE